MLTLTHIRSLLLIGIALASVTYGQTPARDNLPPTEKKKSGRLAWLTATSLPKGIKSPVTVLSGEALIEVRLSKRSVGMPIKVPKDGKVQVVKPILNDEGETTYEILASAIVPEGVKQSLIILTPFPEFAPPLLFKTRVIDLDKFRAGSALFINNTKLEIGVALGDKKVSIKNGQLQIIDIGNFNGSKSMAVSYHYRLPKQKKWHLISASTTSMRSTLREILIFSHNSQFGGVDYHGITFHVPK